MKSKALAAFVVISAVFFYSGCSERSSAQEKPKAAEGPRSDYMKSYNKAKSAIDQVNKIQQDRYGSSAR